MKHHAFAAAMGLLTALLASSSQSLAASPDPSGFWTKEEASDYPAKMEVRKCGKGQLCAKIIWLQVANDSKGKALHDVRNEDPSMRDRPILGMPIFNGLTPSEPGVWTGDIYNPEDGHIYSDIKLTVVSRTQIVIRGCKAWLLCGEKTWKRTSAPPAATPELQEAKAPAAPAPKEPVVEAAAKPQEITPRVATEAAARQPEIKAPESAAAQAPVVEARAEPVGPPPPLPTPKPIPVVGASTPAKPQLQASAGGESDATQALPHWHGAPAPAALKPVLPTAAQDAAAGYGFMLTTATPESAPPFSSERVSTMFVITHPLGNATAPNAPVTDVAVETPEGAADTAPIPLPNQKPKPNAVPQVAKPQVTVEADAAGDVPAIVVKPKPKPVVKKPPEDLPWLQHP